MNMLELRQNDQIIGFVSEELYKLIMPILEKLEGVDESEIEADEMTLEELQHITEVARGVAEDDKLTLHINAILEGRDIDPSLIDMDRLETDLVHAAMACAEEQLC